MDIYEKAVALHERLGGKLEVVPKIKVRTLEDLSMVYTPGVARVCEEIAKDPGRAYVTTMKKNTVAVVTDGSAVLGLGNIGALAALPVMEGKALLFKEYADIDAFPICIQTQHTYEIINIVRNIATGFAGVNLEDISAPRCFEIELALQDLGIPVFHDDQHGTAIVVIAGLLNALKLAGKTLEEVKIVINGGGAAGTAIAELLIALAHIEVGPHHVKEMLVCDTKGIISEARHDIENHPEKLRLAKKTNPKAISGSLADAVKGADVLIGVSAAGAFTAEMVKSMNSRSIVFALANPVPEILPDEAKAAGVFIVGTGRSDFPNQVNNALAFPGIFRGAIDARATVITREMKIAAAYALASVIENPTVDAIVPSIDNRGVVKAVAKAVHDAWVAHKNRMS